MGNSESQQQTGKSVVQSKLAMAHKTKLLSLSGQKLRSVPAELFGVAGGALKTLDLSDNKLREVDPRVGTELPALKKLTLDGNRLRALPNLEGLQALQTLSVANNQLEVDGLDGAGLPAQQLTRIVLASNRLSGVPAVVLAVTALQVLDLSRNRIEVLPDELGQLESLVELYVDDNIIAEVPAALGALGALRVLSLKNNRIGDQGVLQQAGAQSIARDVFENTALERINLHNNPTSNRALMNFEGVEAFLERRGSSKTHALLAGAMVDHTVFGLDDEGQPSSDRSDAKT